MPNEGPVFVRDVRAEYHRGDVLGLGEPRPRLSWISVTDRPDWAQGAYEVEVDGTPAGRRESSDSVFVEWPGAPLDSRERRRVRVRVWGVDGSASEWSDELRIEAGLVRGRLEGAMDHSGHPRVGRATELLSVLAHPA